MLDIGVQTARQADPTLLRLTLFGRMEARTLTGESVLPIGGKTRALLAILALSDRKPVLRSRLSELLWSRRPEEMARASLRQDIHRLLDALSPLGVDVIDVQRHTLSLKPALTSVDAERVLTANSRTLGGLLPPDLLLLGELNGIDPAFDEWIDQQRERITLHIRGVCETRLRELRDPDQIDTEAERLLLMDELNDTAWRARIQAALSRGDHARASAIAENLLKAFERQPDRVPAAQTQALINRVLLPREPGDAADVFQEEMLPGQFVGGADTSGSYSSFAQDSGGVNQQKQDVLLIANKNGAEYFASSLASVLFLTFAADAGCVEHARELAETLELLLVDLGLISVLTTPSGYTPDAINPMQSYQGMGADYLVSGTLRPAMGGAKPRLVLRVLDVRENAAIIWGTHCEIEVVDLAHTRVMLSAAAQSIKWGIVLAEARRSWNLPRGNLSPLGCGVRAFLLMMNRNGRTFSEIEQLLEHARRKDGQQAFIPMLQSLFFYGRSVCDWSIEEDRCQQNALDAARAVIALMPYQKVYLPMLAAALYLNPKTQGQAKSVFAAFMEDAPSDEVILYTIGYYFCTTMECLLAGRMADALLEIEKVRLSPCRSPLYALLDPFFMLISVLAGEGRKVIESGRMLAGMYPHSSGCLVPYLVALITEGGASDEIDAVRTHLLSFSSSLTVGRVMRRLEYLPSPQRVLIENALRQAGLPET